MKSFVAAILALTLGDLAINHGAATTATVQSVRGFFGWVAHVGDQSVFNQ